MTYIKSHLTAIGAALVLLVTTLQQAAPDGHLNRTNVVAVIIAGLGVVLSYVLQNTAGGVRHYTQAIIQTLIVAAQIVNPLVTNGGQITYSQVVIIVMNVISGAAVFWQKDKPALGSVVEAFGPPITRKAHQPEHEATDPGDFTPHV